MPSQFHTSISPGDRPDTWSVSEDFRAKVMKAATDMLGRRRFEYRSTFAGDRRRLIDFRVSRQQKMTRPAATGAKTWPFRSIIISDRMADHQSRSRSSVPRSGRQCRSGTAHAARAGPADLRDGRTRQLESGLGEHERHRVMGRHSRLLLGRFCS
jgi:hypothetical protein